MSTLYVIGAGLVMFLLFSGGLSWARQYLILHTGNRVDAVLGSQVFEHLLKLPPRYYEHRPTGVVITRVHAVETIREFITGAAIALILDLPFLVVFLAIMFWYSWLLTLIALGFLATITIISLAIVPTLRNRINKQFLLGARNQAFLTEYISGIETVKSLQMEPQLKRTFGDYLASFLQASFRTRQLSNTYNVATTTLEQLMYPSSVSEPGTSSTQSASPSACWSRSTCSPHVCHNQSCVLPACGRNSSKPPLQSNDSATS